MANIQPYEYQKRTNIEEHNDLVSKINEIIDVINQTNIETILPKINKLEADVNAINDTDNVQNTDIANLKDKDAQIDNRLTLDENNINGITKSLVSDVVLMNGTTTGNMKARIGRENAPSIDSNDYNIQKPVSVELVQGSASAMVKAKITLSDGTVLISDDFMFTTEAIGTDVYISSFTFKNGNVAGTISADIGLSNGSTLEANNFVVPTDPNVISTISELQSRVTAIESGAGGLTELKATVDGHTTSINNLNTEVAELNATVGEHTTSINALNTDVTNLTTNKADVNNGNQTITAGTINADNINKGGVAVASVNDIPDISGKVNIAQGTENAGKVLGIGEDGNVKPVEAGSNGEVWEEVDITNLPNDFYVGERIKVETYGGLSGSSINSWTTKPTSSNIRPYGGSYRICKEIRLSDEDTYFTGVTHCTDNFCWFTEIVIRTVSYINNYGNIGTINITAFNGAGRYTQSQQLAKSDANVSSYIKIWRLKQST